MIIINCNTLQAQVETVIQIVHILLFQSDKEIDIKYIIVDDKLTFKSCGCLYTLKLQEMKERVREAQDILLLR